jgi:hypothetical protein
MEFEDILHFLADMIRNELFLISSEEELLF